MFPGFFIFYGFDNFVDDGATFVPTNQEQPKLNLNE